MTLDTPYLLAINGGSSSIKFALYQPGATMQPILAGEITRIGMPGTQLSFREGKAQKQHTLKIKQDTHSSVANFLLDWLELKISLAHIHAVGHRVVHGMQHAYPEPVTQALLAELHLISSYDPEHLPLEIKLIELFQHRFPQLPQFACFDTAFHHTLPRVAKILPIPRRFEALGVQRYGFHGLSYEYLLQELERLAGTTAAQGRLILAHLGNGASMAAIFNARSMDTSMGFTPAGGLMMGNRTGDLDPGVVRYLLQTEKLTSSQLNHLINHESGLLGVSETSSDMQDLLKHAATDERALEAIELFCYQSKKLIGSYAAALGGLDTLVFSGGIGENAPVIRARICEDLAFLGIALDTEQNAANAAVISTQSSRVEIRVIHTNEELMIARSVFHLLEHQSERA